MELAQSGNRHDRRVRVLGAAARNLSQTAAGALAVTVEVSPGMPPGSIVPPSGTKSPPGVCHAVAGFSR